MQPAAASTHSASDLGMIEAMTKSAFELAEIACSMAKASVGDARTFLSLTFWRFPTPSSHPSQRRTGSLRESACTR